MITILPPSLLDIQLQRLRDALTEYEALKQLEAQAELLAPVNYDLDIQFVDEQADLASQITLIDDDPVQDGAIQISYEDFIVILDDYDSELSPTSAPPEQSLVNLKGLVQNRIQQIQQLQAQATALPQTHQSQRQALAAQQQQAADQIAAQIQQTARIIQQQQATAQQHFQSVQSVEANAAQVKRTLILGIWSGVVVLLILALIVLGVAVANQSLALLIAINIFFGAALLEVAVGILLHWLVTRHYQRTSSLDVSSQQQTAILQQQSTLQRLQQQQAQIAQSRQQQQRTLSQQQQGEIARLQRDLNQAYEELMRRNLPQALQMAVDGVTDAAQPVRDAHPDFTPDFLGGLTAQGLAAQTTQSQLSLRVGALVYPSINPTIPAALDLVSKQRHVYIAGDDGIALLHAILLRALLTFPVGHLRVSLIDGLRQGKNLALFATKLPDDIGFGHVFDTENGIAAQLQDIRTSISQISQHILVDHPDINSYNAANPELAAPYHLVVIDQFPQGFNNQAQRAMADISANGARTGVIVLATIAERLPQHFTLTDFTNNQYLFKVATQGQFAWNSEYLSSYNVLPDALPTEATQVRLIQLVREAAALNPTVLDYERVQRELPPMWSVPTTQGMISCVGLTFGGKPMMIEFSDSFAHGLIGGRTGSGKTVYIHDLICGLVQTHSPEELQLYLLDFKGTEFNVYMQCRLPHAATVAVDCDVEVGASVIERLGRIMQERIQLFNAANVNDFLSYREKQNKLPRILLIIDEIQELTQYKESRIKNNIEHGLIELFKKGRSYGIHVLAGTQSPTNVLTPEIMQQIAVRICLMADQQVSRLILGDGNEDAARLKQKGEAVVNNFNGAADANVLMRSARLRRDDIVKIVQPLYQHALDLGLHLPEPLYFDGQSRESLLQQSGISSSLQLTSNPPDQVNLSIPIGTPVQIKDTTTLHFSRSLGANLLIVGTNLAQMNQLLVNVLAALTLQTSTSLTRFFLIDLSYVTEPYAEALSAFRAMPHEFQFARNAQLAIDLIEAVYEELGERKTATESGQSVPSSIFLIVFGMENLTTLRGADRFSKPESRKHFEAVMSEGPLTGIHTLVVTQTLEKGTIIGAESFAMRVLFEASDDDSRALLDTSEATKLRPDRAILHRREWAYGKIEKFKPYTALTPAQFEQIVAALGARS